MVADPSRVVTRFTAPFATITSELVMDAEQVKTPVSPARQLVTEVPPTSTKVFELLRKCILNGIPPDVNEPPVTLKPFAAAVPDTVTTVISLLVRAAVLFGLTSRIVIDFVPDRFPLTVIVSEVPATKFTSTKTVPLPLKPPETVSASPTVAPPAS